MIPSGMATGRRGAVVLTLGLLAALGSGCGPVELAQLPSPTRPVAALFATPTQAPTSTATCRPGACTPTPTASPTPPTGRTPTATRAPTSPPKPTPMGGQILFLTDRAGDGSWWARPAVYVMNADGTDQRPAPRPALYDELAQREPWSHSRQQVVFVQWNKASGSYDLFIRNADGWTFYATGGRATEYSPVWSPADNRIAYVTGEDGNDEIHVWNLDTRRDARVTYDPQWDKHPTWSPPAGGARIAFWSNRATGRKQIWVMDSDGRHVRNLSNNPYNDWDPIWVK